MLHVLAVSGYRSLREMVVPLGNLTLITGANGSGKSSLYRSLRLLAETAKGGLIGSLAREGGLQSTLWAGPETITREMLTGEVPVHRTLRKHPVRLLLGFSSDDFCYAIDLGLAAPSESAFALDPIIKRECIWRGTTMRPATLWAERRGSVVRCRNSASKWEELSNKMSPFASMLTEFSDPERSLDLLVLRETIRSWRFYDHFRTDAEAPARQVQIGSFTPVLADDGSNLAAAIQSIFEFGDRESLSAAIEDAFPGSRLQVDQSQGRFELMLEQPGMLRSLSSSELSDGTLRYLLLLAVLFSLRPPELLVLNEPETSLHPDLLPALGRVIANCSRNSQIFVVTHAATLIESLGSQSHCVPVQLEKALGATQLHGIDQFDIPHWAWPAR